MRRKIRLALLAGADPPTGEGQQEERGGGWEIEQDIVAAADMLVYPVLLVSASWLQKDASSTSGQQPRTLTCSTDIKTRRIGDSRFSQN